MHAFVFFNLNLHIISTPTLSHKCCRHALNHLFAYFHLLHHCQWKMQQRKKAAELSLQYISPVGLIHHMCMIIKQRQINGFM